ncbi:MAG: hypothetical protein IJS08_15770 [Victivallales bacterium]|nr:hypothetical protein [Victivallales bacterium]
MTRGEYEQMSLRFWDHYQKACEKHPFFATHIMTPQPIVVIEGASEEWQERTRKYNKRCIGITRAIAKERKEKIKKYPSVQNILGAELAEIWMAVAEGKLEQARYEIADVVAVLIRLDEQLEELHKRQLNPSAYKDKEVGK